MNVKTAGQGGVIYTESVITGSHVQDSCVYLCQGAQGGFAAMSNSENDLAKPKLSLLNVTSTATAAIQSNIGRVKIGNTNGTDTKCPVEQTVWPNVLDGSTVTVFFCLSLR